MRRLVAVLSLLVGMLAAAPATAVSYVNVTSIKAEAYLLGNIHYGSAKASNVVIGRNELRVKNPTTNSIISYLTFCVDITKPLGTGTFSTPGLESYITNPTKLSQLKTLVTNAYSVVQAATTLTSLKQNAAALQLAIWEILYETSTTAYNVANGKFYSSGSAIASAQTIANGWLGKTLSGQWVTQPKKKVTLYYNSKNQSQIHIGPVPEPGTWVSLLLGFGMLGWLVRRRRPIALRPA